MMTSLLKSQMVAVAALLSFIASASAGSGVYSGTHVWGVDSPQASAQASADLRNVESQNAQILAAGPPSSINGTSQQVTNCGSCTSITIIGNGNSINGSTVTSSNTGNSSAIGILQP